MSDLKRMLAGKLLEVVFHRCLAQHQGATPAERQGWRAGIYDQIRAVMSKQGGLMVERMCQLAGSAWQGSTGRCRNPNPWMKR